MKQRIHMVRFGCNGYLKSGSKIIKCENKIEIWGTSEEINKEYFKKGWTTLTTGKDKELPTRGHFHLCDLPHVNGLTGLPLPGYEGILGRED